MNETKVKKNRVVRTLHDFADLDKLAIIKTEETIKPEQKKHFERSEVIVYKTKVYELFSNAPENRIVSGSNVKLIKHSISQHDLKIPIYITKDFIIIDGQHTLVARQELDLPIYFVITTSENYHNDIIIFNTKRKNWNIMNYVTFYAGLGKESYKLLLEVKESAPSLSITILSAILNTGSENRTKSIKNGEFEHTVTDRMQMFKIIEFMEEVVQITSGHLPRTHGTLLVKWAFFNKKFNPDHFVNKLKLQNKKKEITWNSNPKVFAIEVEDLYNKYTAAKAKVRLL